jgi:hypothetical protein
MFIDLMKAYDSLRRDKLIQILRDRCQNDKDRILVDRIA